MSVNHKELSEQIARLYGIDAEIKVAEPTRYGPYTIVDRHITQNIGAMMRLAIENNIDVLQSKMFGYVIESTRNLGDVEENYADHNNDPVEATCVAIAKALIKLKRE